MEANFQKEAALNASRFNWQQFEDEDLKRKFRKIAYLGAFSLSPDEFNEVSFYIHLNYSIVPKIKGKCFQIRLFEAGDLTFYFPLRQL